MQYFYYIITLEFHPLAFVPPSYIFPHPLLPEFLCCSFSSPRETCSYTVSVTFLMSHVNYLHVNQLIYLNVDLPVDFSQDPNNNNNNMMFKFK